RPHGHRNVEDDVGRVEHRGRSGLPRAVVGRAEGEDRKAVRSGQQRGHGRQEQAGKGQPASWFGAPADRGRRPGPSQGKHGRPCAGTQPRSRSGCRTPARRVRVVRTPFGTYRACAAVVTAPPDAPVRPLTRTETRPAAAISTSTARKTPDSSIDQ